jgi:murein L,D-transpeptidase YcbB/YkuD
MEWYKRPEYVTVIFLLFFILSCNSGVNENNLVTDPEDMDDVVSNTIRQHLLKVSTNGGMVDDTIKLSFIQAVNRFYDGHSYNPVWSKNAGWKKITDSLYLFIKEGQYEGLFPNDYHFKNLSSLKQKLDADSLKRMDPVLWAKADMMFTDAFMHLVKDLKQGRLMPDSISFQKDSLESDKLFSKSLQEVISKNQLLGLMHSLQPALKPYWELKKGIKPFVDSMDKRSYIYVTYPYKKGDAQDSAYFIKTLMKRLTQNDCANFSGKMPDSLQLAIAIRKYQRIKGLKEDGKYSTSLIRTMNVSDAERFKRIAITLDRYKQLPEPMPEKYIYVNLPGYYLQVWQKDSIVLESKVICGKPETRTPVLNGNISDMVTYPTWTVPTSIIVKQYLPRLKRDPGYLRRIGFRLESGRGRSVDPANINWNKYSRGIPYNVVQSSGDNNALGIFKFNFQNNYAVYLHDTNQRYLFNNGFRALSHGCVRVQEWKKLAFYIARNDSINSKRPDSLRYNTDSINNWIRAKDRHVMLVKNTVPLFIRYFGCDGVNGKIRFYEDIYGEDKVLREKYFSEKE